MSKKEKKVSTSKSGMAVAKFLLKNYPKEAQQIASGMEKAATAKTMKRRQVLMNNLIMAGSVSVICTSQTLYNSDTSHYTLRFGCCPRRRLNY
jgi:hypothetical protein